MAPDNVRFAKKRNGLSIILSDEDSFAGVLNDLRQRLKTKPPAISGTEVNVDVGNRILSSSQLLELEDLIDEFFGVKLIRISHGLNRSDLSEPAPPPEPAETAYPGLTEETEEAEEEGGPRPEPPQRLESRENTVLIRRTLRSGQRVRYRGNIVVAGDVNPGAEVIADGDIIVLGVLRGVAHAGAAGWEEASVAAFRLEPLQLRIGSLIARAPEGDPVAHSEPEIAFVRGNQIVIESYAGRSRQLIKEGKLWVK